MSYFLGIDGGGSKTDCVLLDAPARCFAAHRAAHPILSAEDIRRRGFRSAVLRIWCSRGNR